MYRLWIYAENTELAILHSTNGVSKYGGMDVSMLTKVKELEAQNNRLKRMYADLQLDHDILKEVMQKKVLKPSQRKQMAKFVVKHYNLSIRRSCKMICISQTSYRYANKNSSANEKDI